MHLRVRQEVGNAGARFSLGLGLLLLQAGDDAGHIGRNGWSAVLWRLLENVVLACERLSIGTLAPACLALVIDLFPVVVELAVEYRLGLQMRAILTKLALRQAGFQLRGHALR